MKVLEKYIDANRIFNLKNSKFISEYIFTFNGVVVENPLTKYVSQDKRLNYFLLLLIKMKRKLMTSKFFRKYLMLV